MWFHPIYFWKHDRLELLSNMMATNPNVIEADPEAASLAKLTTISPPTSSGPVIAVDLDDVLSQTNHVVSECKYRSLSLRRSENCSCSSLRRAQWELPWVRNASKQFLLWVYLSQTWPSTFSKRVTFLDYYYWKVSQILSLRVTTHFTQAESVLGYSWRDTSESEGVLLHHANPHWPASSRGAWGCSGSPRYGIPFGYHHRPAEDHA